MAYDLNKHHRRSIRLKGYDYTQSGAYFVTICTQNRDCLFGMVADGDMRLNELGRIVEWTWDDLPNHMDNVQLDAFVVMPNHVHGIVVIKSADTPIAVGAGSVGAGSEPAPTTTAVTRRIHALSEIVRQFKTFSAHRINQMRGTQGVPVWQRNYYEHVIRNEESLNRIRCYIAENALRWAFDRENPGAITPEPEQAWLA